MHYDSRLHLLCLALLALAPSIIIVNALLIPPEIQQENIEALQYYNQFIEQLHEQSGEYHARFRELAFQQAETMFIDASDDDADDIVNYNGDKLDKNKKKEKKKPDNGDHAKEQRVPVILGVMSKCPDAEVSLPFIVPNESSHLIHMHARLYGCLLANAGHTLYTARFASLSSTKHSHPWEIWSISRPFTLVNSTRQSDLMA